MDYFVQRHILRRGVHLEPASQGEWKLNRRFDEFMAFWCGVSIPGC